MRLGRAVTGSRVKTTVGMGEKKIKVIPQWRLVSFREDANYWERRMKKNKGERNGRLGKTMHVLSYVHS